MATKKRKTVSKAKSKKPSPKKPTRKAIKKAPKRRAARSHAKKAPVRKAKAPVAAPETEVTVYEVVETQVYGEPNPEPEGGEDEFGT